MKPGTAVTSRSGRTKIVATLGPASSSEEIVRAIFEGGADVFRLNSHGSHEEHAARYRAIRDVESATGRPAVLMDLQGP